MTCDTAQLVNDSRCLESCLTPGMQIPALISLFCQISDKIAGVGTVTSFSSGDLSPLFTTSVATPTTTPALSFSLSNQANNVVFAGPNGGGPAAPTFRSLVLSDITGLGTGVATALAVNVGTAGAFVVNGGALGTPSGGTLTNCTGLPISTGVSGLAANVATFLATPSSANMAAAVTDETGTGALVFAGSPTLTGTVVNSGDENFTGTARIFINGTLSMQRKLITTNLTSGVGATVCTIGLPTSGKHFCLQIIWGGFCTDGTNHQAITQRTLVNAVNKAGTVTAAQGTPEASTAAASSGTLTTSSVNVTVSGTNVLVNRQLTTSLTPTTLKIDVFSIDIITDDAALTVS